MRNSTQPELSIVVTSRNDDHGGNLSHRMQVFVEALAALTDKYHLDWELIVVEWNPPVDAKSLADELIWPISRNTITVRLIEVPPELHARLPNTAAMQLPQFEAKNVGIRRARGKYVLATNMDILFSEKLVTFLASGKLRTDCFYRVSRFDVGMEVPLGVPVEEQLEFCAKHVLGVWTLNSTYETRKKKEGFRVFGSVLKLMQKIRPWHSREGIYTNACGDFTLMAKQHWHSLHGYPEIAGHAYVDGLMCYMAASMGLRQVILSDPMRIYHQEHDLGFRELLQQPCAANRPVMDYQQYRTWCVEMLRSGQPKIFNDEGWGLGREDLVERTII